MKKLLLALLAVTGLTALAPHAEAGQYARVYSNGGVVYVPKVALLGQSYVDQVAYNNARARYLACHRPHRRTYYRDSYYTQSYSRPVEYRSCESYRAPRVAFSFGY